MVRRVVVMVMAASLAGCEQGPQPVCVAGIDRLHPEEEYPRCADGWSACCTLHGPRWEGDVLVDCGPAICVDGAPTCDGVPLATPYPEGTHLACAPPHPGTSP